MNDRIKVLMLGPARSVKGGVSGVVNNLYDAGLGDTVSIKYIPTMKDGSKLRKLLVAGIAYIRAGLSMGRYDIVHINMACGASYYRKSLFIKMAIRKGKKLVIHQHGGDVEAFYKGTLKGAARQEMLRLLNSCSAFIVLADKFRDFFSDIITDKDKIYVLPNAVAVPEDDKTGSDHKSHDILFLGRICRDKGCEELVDAVEELAADYPDIRLHMGGFFEDSSLRDKVLRDPEHIIFEGWVDPAGREELFRTCPIFVLPSYYEGMPLSLMEAMAYKRACIASDVGDIRNMMTVDDESQLCGLLIPPRDMPALKNAITKLLADPKLCGELGTAARNKAVKSYSAVAMRDKLVEIYQKI
ncbi:glycosyltransferase family 4 protein [Butyrivibrio sp. MC2013]|uniref:glycosyltransferase family 4 protein n=1 Tax=Butyrivibrio sp. MC2013 TaxID=1280686 RepID=UPI00040E01CE|nr:glycosyltransferase family 4 protein [Butyrivibrio sp. MC2013]